MKHLFALMFLAVALAARGADTNYVPMDLQGQTFIHDPSTIIKDQGRYYVFGTGPGVRIKSSADLIHWQNEGTVFDRPLPRERNIAPGFDGSFWAPDIIRLKGRFFLYYAVSAWGKQTSAIELATNATLDLNAKEYHWQDAGEVIRSTNSYDYNTIDPSVFQDTDGRLWLAFGSFWHGIYLTELNPETGLRLNTNAPTHLAWNNSIEASCLTRHDKYYYLFVNWGQCCKGTNSTYQVRMGRAEKITGPYLDREGFDLATGGGTPFLSTSGRFIGPGHIGIVIDDSNTNGVTLFSYHYYDAATFGRSRLAVGRIDWSSGWPVAVN